MEAEQLLEVQGYLLVREDDIPGWEFHLASVTPELWEYMNKFTREFDYDRGESEWHIFDGRGDWIRVSGHKGSRFLDHAFIYAKEGGNLPPRYIYLTYGVPEWFLESIGRTWGLWKDNIGPRGIWTARYTRNWLLSKFIPQVCKHYGLAAKAHCDDVYTTTATTFSTTHTPVGEAEEAIPLQQVIHPKQLSHYLDEIHSWLYNYGLNISTKNLFDFFQAFRVLVQEVDPHSVDVSYIKGKLYVIERGHQENTETADIKFGGNQTYKDVLNYLDEYLGRLAQTAYMSSEDAELLLRVFSAILRGEFIHFHQSELNAVKRTIQPVWELSEFERRYVVTQWRWTGLWYEK